MLPPLHCFSYCYQLYLFCAQKLSHTLRCVLFSHRPLCYLVSSCVISSSVCRLFFSFVSSFFLVPLFLRAVNCFLCDCSAHSVWLLPDFFCRFGQLYKSNFCFCYSHNASTQTQRRWKKIIPTTARHKKKLYACNTMLVYGTEQWTEAIVRWHDSPPFNRLDSNTFVRTLQVTWKWIFCIRVFFECNNLFCCRSRRCY